MSINPATPTYATADLLRSAAVQDVDISAPGPNGQTSGKALVVALAGGAAGVPSGSIQTVQGDPAGTPIPISSAAIGTVTDAPWDGVSASATVISLLKKIALNTTTP